MAERCYRVLLVDDDERALYVLYFTLKRLGNGYEWVTALGGKAARSHLQTSDFDMLITDVRMPQIDGIGLTKVFLEENPDGQVIWLTAHGCHRVRDAAEYLDIYQCMNKPLEIDKIRQAVRRALTVVG
jgi:DNA-binding NtrC family response regulator